ncbi:hypothetical protein A2U01_0060680, partial [Trifolium medium]|nr:hypothetical protein [Trifolium medium]
STRLESEQLRNVAESETHFFGNSLGCEDTRVNETVGEVLAVCDETLGERECSDNLVGRLENVKSFSPRSREVGVGVVDLVGPA